MEHIMAVLGSILIGYVCGNFLTARAVVRLKEKKGIEEIGTGNPGMANVAAQLGVGWGLLVLALDGAKTVLAVYLCRRLLFWQEGDVMILYAGLGTVLGHNYPFWHQFKGGKGVAVTCVTLLIASPLWGMVCCVAGLVAVLLTKYLAVGALVIPVLFIVPAFLHLGSEAGIAASVIAAIMLIRHIGAVKNIAAGTEKKTKL